MGEHRPNDASSVETGKFPLNFIFFPSFSIVIGIHSNNFIISNIIFPINLIENFAKNPILLRNRVTCHVRIWIIRHMPSSEFSMFLIIISSSVPQSTHFKQWKFGRWNFMKHKHINKRRKKGRRIPRLKTYFLIYLHFLSFIFTLIKWTQTFCLGICVSFLEKCENLSRSFLMCVEFRVNFL